MGVFNARSGPSSVGVDGTGVSVGSDCVGVGVFVCTPSVTITWMVLVAVGGKSVSVGTLISSDDERWGNNKFSVRNIKLTNRIIPIPMINKRVCCDKP